MNSTVISESDWEVHAKALFHRRHEELYAYASPDQEVVFANARVVAIGIVPQGASVSRGAAAVSACAPSGKRNAFFGAWKEVP